MADGASLPVVTTEPVAAPVVAATVSAVPVSALPVSAAVPTPQRISLRLGDDATLDRTHTGNGQGSCIAKREGATVFCIEAVTWPAALRKAFDTNTVMYQGSRAIVRYDRGEATSLYAVFGVSAFDSIAAWVEGQFGPPTSTATQRLAVPGKPPADNQVRIWRAHDPASGKATALELRSIDNVRNAFPDREHGILMLYREDADSIFPQLSSIDLMMLR